MRECRTLNWVECNQLVNKISENLSTKILTLLMIDFKNASQLVIHKVQSYNGLKILQDQYFKLAMPGQNSEGTRAKAAHFSGSNLARHFGVHCGKSRL